jgi:acyl-CoA synthetase (AMP-forming)/AMP-acid ligase II
MNTLLRSFEALCRREPGRPLLCARPGSPWITAATLRRRAGAFAGRLADLGVVRGEVCAIAAGNRPAFVTAVIAVWLRGGVVLPIEEGLPHSEIERLREAFAPGVIVRARRGRLFTEVTSAPERRHPGAAMIRLTSGSTGAARGALVTPAQLAADGRAIMDRMGITPADMNIAAIPLGHSYGFDNIVVPLMMRGVPALVLESPLPSLILRAFRTRRPTVFPSVPYLLGLLARHPDPHPRGSGLRLCVSAGAPLPSRTAREFRERYGVTVRSFYGASEAGGITCDADADPAGEGSVGTAMPSVTIAIDRRGLGHLPPGEGRVIVKGPAVASGYLPSASPDLSDGRFRTSDIGRLDSRGHLHLTGRISSLVNISGRKVNPLEIEGILREADGIEDAAVLGVADHLRGERLEAWIVGGGLDGAAPVRRMLEGRLSSWKIPRVIRIVDAIPRTERGKVDRVRLLGSRARSRRSRPPRSRC